MTAAVYTPPINIVRFTATTAITANSTVKLSAVEGFVEHTTAIADDVIGIARTTAAPGAAVEVEVTAPIVKVRLAGTVAIGNQLMPSPVTAGAVLLAAGPAAKSCLVALAAGVAGDVVMAIPRLHLNGPANV